MTKRPFEQILTVADLETTADRLGNYFFTPATMQFFKSRIGYRLFSVDNERGYFATSDKDNERPRRCTVHKYEVKTVTRSDGREVDSLNIESVSKVGEFVDMRGAEYFAEKLQGYALIDPKSFDIER